MLIVSKKRNNWFKTHEIHSCPGVIYLAPQELQNVEAIIDQLGPHIRNISTQTYYRKRKEAVEVLSSVLWGYTAQDSAEIVREFCGQ